jgi:hypothetical protein
MTACARHQAPIKALNVALQFQFPAEQCQKSCKKIMQICFGFGYFG